MIEKVKVNNNQKAFFELLRAGLFPKREFKGSKILAGARDQVRAQDFKGIDWDEVYQLAEEQSVVGLIAAGIDCLPPDVKPPQELTLQFIGKALQIEQQNKAMNEFLVELVEKLLGAGVYALLLKGQGIAQCYENPLWRSCGDVDLLLSEENYRQAKNVLQPLAFAIENEYTYTKHLGMTIKDWVVELHGTLRCKLSKRIDKTLDEIQGDTFHQENLRSWQNGSSQVFMLSPVNDAVYVFTHFLNHFYKEGLGLRQICDWCRLLYTYREKLDLHLLEQRIMKMGLMTEWRAFGAFAVEYLGMDAGAIPFYSSSVQDVQKFKNKAERIKDFILMSGNFGHNRDMSHFGKYPFIARKCVSMGRRVGDLIYHAKIFPLDSLKFFPFIMFSGIRSAIRGEG